MKIDLNKFCSTSQVRPNLWEPFSFGDYTYATNGHISVRVPLISSAVLGESCDAPVTIEKLFECFDQFEFESLLEIKLPAPVTEKQRCGGGHDCPTCFCSDECEDCNGARESLQVKTGPVFINGVPFDSYYIALIKTLPAAEFQKDPKALVPAYFKFEGGCGAVMPLKEPATQTRYQPLTKPNTDKS